MFAYIRNVHTIFGSRMQETKGSGRLVTEALLVNRDQVGEAVALSKRRKAAMLLDKGVHLSLNLLLDLRVMTQDGSLPRERNAYGIGTSSNQII